MWELLAARADVCAFVCGMQSRCGCTWAERLNLECETLMWCQLVLFMLWCKETYDGCSRGMVEGRILVESGVAVAG